MSASAAPPNRSRCRGTPAHSAQGANPAATPLCPCGDPQLRGEAPPLVRGYRSARRPASGSAEIDAPSEVVASLGNDRLWKTGIADRAKVRHPAPSYTSSWAKVGYGVSSPIRRVVSHRLLSAESRHRYTLDRTG